MSLRINTNAASLTALRNLRNSEHLEQRSLQRLSTGLRINSAADDPSGLVISEQLRNQVASIKQALRNSQDASNMIGTTEAALGEVSSLLTQVRESVVFALNTGGNSPEQIQAEQDSVDNLLGSIDRIAETTSFASRKLLDGSSAIKSSGVVGAGIKDMDVKSVQFDGKGDLSFSIAIQSAAERAHVLDAGFSAAENGTVIRLTGALGTEEISLGSSFDTADVTANQAFDDAINAVTGSTGVYASNGSLFSTEYGSDASVTVQVVSGQVTLADGSTLDSSSSAASDDGADVDAFVNGAHVAAQGNKLHLVSSFLTADFTLADGADAASDTSFSVKNSGLAFQLNQGAALSNRERLGIRSVDTSTLGGPAQTLRGVGGVDQTVGGFLSSLMSGGENDLTADPTNALRIVDAAIADVNGVRAYLGSFKSGTIDTNMNSLSVAAENLEASESTIRDLDFAAETTELTRTQILYQSGIAVLAQANVMSQSVLSLLT